MMQQYKVVTYVRILMSMKTKIKVLKIQAVAISEFCKYEWHFCTKICIVLSNLNEPQRKNNERKQEKHFVQKQQFTILMCCNDFDSFLLHIDNTYTLFHLFVRKT